MRLTIRDKMTVNASDGSINIIAHPTPPVIPRGFGGALQFRWRRHSCLRSPWRCTMAKRITIALAAFLPWLRIADATFALYFLVLVAGGPALFPLTIAFALLSAPVLLLILPAAAIWFAVRQRPPRVIRIATCAGLILSLAYHVPTAAFVAIVTVKDAAALTDLLDYPMLSLLVSAAITGAATWFARQPVNA